MKLEVGRQYGTSLFSIGRIRILSTTAPAPGGPIIFETVDDGKLHRTSELGGLTPVPEEFRITSWTNIYRAADGKIYVGTCNWSSRPAALRSAHDNLIACVEVEITGTEGDGLEDIEKEAKGAQQ